MKTIFPYDPRAVWNAINFPVAEFKPILDRGVPEIYAGSISSIRHLIYLALRFPAQLVVD